MPKEYVIKMKDKEVCIVTFDKDILDEMLTWPEIEPYKNDVSIREVTKEYIKNFWGGLDNERKNKSPLGDNQ